MNLISSLYSAAAHVGRRIASPIMSTASGTYSSMGRMITLIGKRDFSTNQVKKYVINFGQENLASLAKFVLNQKPQIQDRYVSKAIKPVSLTSNQPTTVSSALHPATLGRITLCQLLNVKPSEERVQTPSNIPVIVNHFSNELYNKSLRSDILTLTEQINTSLNSLDPSLDLSEAEIASIKNSVNNALTVQFEKSVTAIKNGIPGKNNKSSLTQIVFDQKESFLNDLSNKIGHDIQLRFKQKSNVAEIHSAVTAKVKTTVLEQQSATYNSVRLFNERFDRLSKVSETMGNLYIRTRQEDLPPTDKKRILSDIKVFNTEADSLKTDFNRLILADKFALKQLRGKNDITERAIVNLKQHQINGNLQWMTKSYEVIRNESERLLPFKDHMDSSQLQDFDALKKKIKAFLAPSPVVNPNGVMLRDVKQIAKNWNIKISD